MSKDKDDEGEGDGELPQMVEGVLSLFESATGAKRVTVSLIEAEEDAMCRLCDDTTPKRIKCKSARGVVTIAMCDGCLKQIKDL